MKFKIPQLDAAALYGDSEEPLSMPPNNSSLPTSLSPTSRNFNKQSYGLGDPGPGDLGSVCKDMGTQNENCSLDELCYGSRFMIVKNLLLQPYYVILSLTHAFN